jgi:hypothetical protein
LVRCCSTGPRSGRYRSNMESEYKGFESHDTVRVRIEEIHQLIKAAPVEGSVICQVCGKELRAGTTVTAYAYRSSHHGWTLGQTRCGDHPLCLTRHATLGVDECRLSGRIARVVDQATQQTYPIILAPTVDTVAPPQEAPA